MSKRNNNVEQLWNSYLSSKGTGTEMEIYLRNQLFKIYDHLPKIIARRLYGTFPSSSFLELDDLISAGNFGLIESIKDFDYARKT